MVISDHDTQSAQISQKQDERNHVPKCMSCHKAIVAITGRAYCFHDNIYIYICIYVYIYIYILLNKKHIFNCHKYFGCFT